MVLWNEGSISNGLRDNAMADVTLTSGLLYMTLNDL